MFLASRSFSSAWLKRTRLIIWSENRGSAENRTVESLVATSTPVGSAPICVIPSTAVRTIWARQKAARSLVYSPGFS
jgi:hypothetical protein